MASAPNQARSQAPDQTLSPWRASAIVVAAVVLVSLLFSVPLLIRIFLFQPFNIPAGSLKPTLLVGDYIFVSKYSYGYTRYSFPFSPPLALISGRRILASEPQRGDVVVFRLPKDPAIDYVKRVVGLPGERIRMINGLLHINGEPIKRERIEDFVETEDNGRQVRVRQWRETLPNGVSHPTLDLLDNGFYDNTKEYLVPPGHYFMMGDNRDNSTDSRVESAVGYVPFENLIGRVEVIFWSVEPSNEGRRYRFDRIGMRVR
jgi:signal peptidase I